MLLMPSYDWKPTMWLSGINMKCTICREDTMIEIEEHTYDVFTTFTCNNCDEIYVVGLDDNYVFNIDDSEGTTCHLISVMKW